MTASSRTLEHVGEWKLELRGASIDELFLELARVLAEAGGPRDAVRGSDAWEHVELEARDYSTLLIDWANELIGRSEVAGLAYRHVRNLSIGAEGGGGSVRLSADVRGDALKEWTSPVKAATYHDASVSEAGNEWCAVVVLDDRQLSCAPASSPEGKAYLSAMACAANFAWSNRQCVAHT